MLSLRAQVERRGGVAIASVLLLAAMGYGGCNRGAPPAEPATEAPRASGEPKTGARVGSETAPPTAAPAATRPAAPQSGATATGRASLIGKPPPVEAQPRGSDPFCAGLVRTDESLVVDPRGGLQNVLVRVVEGGGGPYAPPAEPVRLTQAECRYSPRVLGVVRGQPVLVSNSDGTLHNVHALLGESTVLNQLQLNAQAPLIDLRQVVAVARTSPLKLRCDIHPWMAAYLFVLEHPFFAVTAADGTFTIKNLPVGEYVLEAWHERLGTRQAKLSVAAAAPASPTEFRFALEPTAPTPSSEPKKPAPLPTPRGG